MTISNIGIYDINAYLRDDSTVQSIAGKTMSFFPIVGDGSETAPFVVYTIAPSIPTPEAWWNRYDAVSYSIYDTNIDRMLRLGERFIYLLGKGDEISQSGGKEGTDVRLLSTYFVDSSVEDAIEKDGWFTMNLDFIIYFVPK
jgi:hypothetical protein